MRGDTALLDIKGPQPSLPSRCTSGLNFIRSEPRERTPGSPCPAEAWEACQR